jgi:hypothetical protein
MPATGGAMPTTVNRVSEMTMMTSIRQGFTAPLRTRPFGFDPNGAPVRYVDNLRLALAIVAAETQSGHWIVLDDIATIHFARWIILPGNQQLLFATNFDGSWDQYLHDFTTIANSGKPTPDNPQGIPWLDLVWGNCDGWPGTGDFGRFTAWVSAHMVPTTLFYPAISDVTIRDVAWLRKFRSLFATFDERALTVDRRTWPQGLLAAYDEFKTAVNRIDVTDV